LYRLSHILVFVLALAVLLAPANVRFAFAQETKSPSILEFFGLKPDKPKATQKRQGQKVSARKKVNATKPKVGRKKVSSKSKPAELLQPVLPVLPQAIAGLPAIPEKLPNAKTILVIGDFMADGVSEGIEQAFEGDAGVIVLSRANGSSGFIRDDFYNWPEELVAIVAETKPTVIAVMIGTNDRQPLRLNGERELVRSLEWTSEYERRVAKFADALKATATPVVWIGMPPFKQPTMSADMLVLNDIYRKNTERVSGTFVDIWDGFLDEQGVFNINGSDYIGQPVRLRASDGINLTFAGKRKTAFFAEKPLRLALGDVGTAATSAFNPFNLPGPKPMAIVKPLVITHLAPVSLFDPAFDGDTELLGDNVLTSKELKTPAKALYADGIALKPTPGRIDQVNIAPVRSDASPIEAKADTP
jgi:uncharacterized protein